MRKYMREILRRRGEKLGVKPSRYVATQWNRYEARKLGEAKRRANKAHGTKPKRLWKSRIV